jgi:Ti-type conjugative transfer relaxase TraA
MAIYHFEAQAISRSQGRSSVAASAYRSSEKLIDQRTGLTHDFTRKNDVIESEILLPKNAPEKLLNRETLWNEVEKAEKRKDSQVAREINIALPKELSQAQNWKLAKTYVHNNFVDKGMIADLNFHNGHSGREGQPHVHVMLTMRRITPDGFGKKSRSWNDKNLLNHWRHEWAEACNLALAKNGFDIRIDHRTLEAQGINLEAQSKIGPDQARAKMARAEEHQQLARRNGTRILKDPSIALNAITQQQSTFTHQDIARFVNRHTADSEQFKQVYEKVKLHPSLVYLGKDDHQRDRYSTVDMVALENNMINQAVDKAQVAGHVVSDKYISQAISKKSLSIEQQDALKYLSKGGDVVCVSGFAGTGKSYMLGAAKDAWESQGYRVQGMALSGIAVENLASGSGISSHTVSNRTWYWNNGLECLDAKDIVVVDEAGMLGSRQVSAIMDEAHKSGAKVVFVGDPEQLQAIEAGAAFRAVSEKVGCMQMNDIRRQEVGWQKKATINFATSRTSEGLDAYKKHNNIQLFDKKEAAINGLIERWDEFRLQCPNKSQIILGYTRDEVRVLNDKARETRRAHKELGCEHKLNTGRGVRNFSENDRIYFLRNEYNKLYVKNGTLGTIEKINGNKLTVKLDSSGINNARSISFNLKDYSDIDHGYAATVHKSQGVTVNRTHVLASPYFDRHTTYVAMSRHREGVDLYYSRDVFSDYGKLNQTLSRDRNKDITLDYADIRGFSKDKSISGKFNENHYKAAAKELSKSRYEKVMNQDRMSLERKMGLELSFKFKEGDFGIYRGSSEIAGRRYGVIEQKDGHGKLIPIQQVESRQMGKELKVERHCGKLRAAEPREFMDKERFKSRNRDSGRDRA